MKLGIGAILLVMLATACTSEPTTVRRAKTVRAWEPQQTPSRNARSGSAVVVDDEIARRCNLPRAHFDFDSAALTTDASQALDALTQCFMTGPLRDRAMKIVGHADPRGSVEYNFALGQRRAGSVAAYLESRGLDPNRMATSSMGELEARGNEESSWAEDRRVEILLAGSETSGRPSRPL